jgi:hypothetical protein
MSNKQQQRKQHDVELNEWKARHDLDTLLAAAAIQDDPRRILKVRKLAMIEISNMAYAASLNVEFTDGV